MARFRLRGLFLGPDADEFWRHREKYARARTALGRKWHSIRCQRICQLNGASIPMQAAFAGRPAFPHGLAGVMISRDARLGRDCVIFQQVTIGSNTLADAKRPGSPTLGDRVYIGAGAKIVGAVTLGDDVRVGANCVVFEDVPANATVVLPRPRVILRDDPPDNAFHRV